jgi:hypothetical protein
MKSSDAAVGKVSGWRACGLVAVCLILLLGWFFRAALRPEMTTFNNDTPLGVLHAEQSGGLDAMLGVWQDLNWLGNASISAIPNVTRLTLSALGPLGASKFYAAFTLLFAGMGAWFCFWRWKFALPVCFLAALATVFHGNYFPNACWGVGSQVIGFGLNFIALGLLADEHPRTRWASVLLAGFAVGLGVTEAFDIGALFSITVAAFIVWQALARGGNPVKNLALGGVRVALVAAFAGFIAVGMVSSLVGTQIQGVANMGQDESSKARRWDEATMWSTPPIETVGVMVPAIFGFRMDTPEGGAYWGRGGRVEAWDRFLAEGPLAPGDIVRVQASGTAALAQARQLQVDGAGKLNLPGAEALTLAGLSHGQAEEAVKAALTKAGATSVAFQVEMPGGFIKYGGGGGYAGALVLVLVAFAIFQALRGDASAFTAYERRIVGFWVIVAVVSLLLSYGRFAPFYQLFYALPYASTMRIPGKFGHIFAWATLMLFAFGAQALWKQYVSGATATTRGLLDQWSAWWGKAGGGERRWIFGSLGAFALLLAAAGWYYTSRGSFENYIARVNFFEMATQGRQPDAETAAALAKAQFRFSLGQVTKAVGFFAGSFALVGIALSGYFAGARAKVATGLFAALLLAELGPASAPWVVTYNWKDKYLAAADNPVIEYLRQRPHEGRVAISSGTLRGLPLGILDGVYGGDWKQHLFQYYNIQTIDIVQMPRVPVEVQQWEGALFFDGSEQNLHLPWRRWQLMNVRHILSRAGVAEALNLELKPNAPFREVMRFDFYQAREGGPILTRTNAQAQYALLEYTGALPRAQLYGRWQVSTNDEATLQTLRARDFDPATTVLVAESIVAPAGTNATGGTVEFASYAPRRISLKARAAAPAVLLLNDKHHPAWQVTVNGQPAPLLRCNYTMRGVQVPAGESVIEFRYAPPLRTLYITLAATALLILLAGYVVWAQRSPRGGAAT